MHKLGRCLQQRAVERTQPAVRGAVAAGHIDLTRKEYTMIRRSALLFASLTSIAAPATADIITFASDPFAGSTALETPGRQVVGTNELFLPSFDTALDQFVFDRAFFDIGPAVSFASGEAPALPLGGANVVVLLSTDNDANPATAFNAGTAANLIAAQITTPGAGFFIYWNSSLSVNRLVYSTNLDDSTADLAILARITSPTGADAIATLPLFGGGNFGIIPAPASGALLALAGLAAARRRR
jgi:hypothetical protein